MCVTAGGRRRRRAAVGSVGRPVVGIEVWSVGTRAPSAQQLLGASVEIELAAARRQAGVEVAGKEAAEMEAAAGCGESGGAGKP